jgi:hypothetical protein
MGEAITRHSLRPLVYSRAVLLSKLGRIAPRECITPRECELLVGNNSFLHVVPAKAGTHNHRRILLSTVQPPAPTTTQACGYGSRRSPGRRRASSFEIKSERCNKRHCERHRSNPECPCGDCPDCFTCTRNDVGLRTTIRSTSSLPPARRARRQAPAGTHNHRRM